ncbi:helix-turn-helix domain-containing protein [Pseudomonas sp. SIMBA_077]
MAIVFPLEHLQAKERFDYWQDVVCSTFAHTTNHRLTDEPFDGSLDVRLKGDISYSRIRSLPIKYERGRIDDGNDPLFVTLTLCPDAYLSQSGRTSRQRPRDIVLFDSAQPYTCTLPQGDDQIVLAIPRQRLLSHMPHCEQFLSRTLDNQSPLGNLARSMLLEMWSAQAQPGVVGERLNGALLDVLASAFEAAYGSTLSKTTRRRDDRLERAKRYIFDNLHDTNLSVASISGAIHVSDRTLNRLFATQGTTVIRWLWQQRLAACHEAMLKGSFRHVSEVALRFGFTNLSHFSRAFKHTYGIPPQQLLRQN